MNQCIILISGFGGTGKSTCANLLFNKLDECALVEADHLFNIKPWAIGDKLGRIKLRNSLDVLQNFINEGYQHVICVGLVWSQAELDAVVQQFPAQTHNLFLFWLSANKATRFDRVIKRGEPGDTEEFLEHVEQTVPDPWPLLLKDGHAEYFNTHDTNPEAVATLMLQLVLAAC